MLLGALLLSGCVNDTLDEIAAPEGEVTFVVGDFKQFESADGRAVGTPDAGKTAWEVGDELLVTTDEGGYTTLTLGESGVWVATQSLTLTPDSNIAVAYAPNCELVDGVITPKSDLPLGTGEYFYGSATYAEGTVTISFAETVRTYSRLRLAAVAGKSLSVAVTGFTPAGATEQIDANYTLTTDEKGNAYLYGIIAAGGTLAVDNSGTTTERTLANGTVAGKSYALYSKGYFYLPTGGVFNEALADNLVNITALKFVAGSMATSENLLFTDEFGSNAYAISNGNTLEIHTACDEFMANADCYEMFAFGALTTIDFNDCFNTSQVNNMRRMFSGLASLTTIDVSGFDTSKVTNFDNMFLYCESLTSIDVSGFDTSQATTMSSMFSGCSSLTSIDVSGFDTSQVTDMSDMFSGCESLTSIDLSGFDTSKVTNMYGMFSFCRALTSVDLSGFDTSQVTDMSYMFCACNDLPSLDLSSFDTPKVTNVTRMFENCYLLGELDLTSLSFYLFPTVEDMFRNIGSELDVAEVPVYVTKWGRTFFNTRNFKYTKAKFLVHLIETTLDGEAAYEVTYADDLLVWAEATKENPNLGLVIGDDIDLTGMAWTPVGTPEAPYTGSVEGHNHKITGLDIDVTVGGETAPTGLFGTLSYADIRNFSVYGDIEIKANDKSYVGGVAGNVQCSKITNVHSYVNIHADQGVTGAQRVGGIAGGAGLDISYEDRVIISRSSFNGSINVPDASQTVGGILGYTTSRVEINNCANYGEITATNAKYVGGILGYANVWTLYGPYNCLNVGTVTGAEKASAIVGWLRCYSVNTIHTNYFLAGTASEAFGGPLRDEEVENNVASGPAEAVSVDAAALASGTVTSALNNGDGNIWTQGTDYPELDRTKM